ncbi:MAG TPA: hypothetical protein VGB73_06995 [Pyrinomonadaceae bacterium]|jgi:hypothetical protein
MRVEKDSREQKKRCWFCEEALADKACAAVVEMHKGGFKGRRYEVSDSTTVGVPRCARCKSVHDRVEGLVARGGIFGLLMGTVASLLILSAVGFDWATDYWRALLKAMAALGMVGGVAAWACGRLLIPKGVKDQRTREHHASVQQKIREGWKVGPKPPGL